MKANGRMGLISAAAVTVLAGFLTLGSAEARAADAVPGDVIDKSNCQKAQDLLPAPVLEWVKKGDFSLQVGKLNYEMKEYFPLYVQESLRANLGKYDVNEKDMIVDKATGKVPGYIEGVPFPEIDLADPKAATKVLHNRELGLLFNVGNCVYHPYCQWVGKGGLERELGALYINAPMSGNPQAKDRSNTEGILRYTIIAVIKPYDVAGFAMMLWRYQDDRQDMNLSYLPAIRRVRRMSPANRSDSFVGSDFCIDDPYGYDGKVTAFSWKMLRKQEALVPFVSPDPEKIQLNAQGEWETRMPRIAPVYGYEKPELGLAAWAPTNFIWVKRPVYVIEALSRDPYYNYGKMEVWADAENYGIIYKVIYDRAGLYWKTFYAGFGGVESEDGKTRFLIVRIQNIVDDRTQHASVIANHVDPEYFGANLSMDDFTLAGFQKYCK
mgnify:FL=1